jgi:hypothetical protein
MDRMAHVTCRLAGCRQDWPESRCRTGPSDAPRLARVTLQDWPESLLFLFTETVWVAFGGYGKLIVRSRRLSDRDKDRRAADDR